MIRTYTIEFEDVVTEDDKTLTIVKDDSEWGITMEITPFATGKHHLSPKAVASVREVLNNLPEEK